jgi:hypothetical protein
MWRALRIAILAIALVVAVGVTWGDRLRTTGWTDTLWIGVYPVDGDGRPATAEYIAGLEPRDLADIEAFFAREAEAHGVALGRPVRVELYPPVAGRPPLLAPDAGPLGVMAWSLRLRWYAWRAASGTLADVRVFVLYHDPEAATRVPHSVGLQKGLVGVVYAWAAGSMTGQNSIVIAHEVLHTLGATDKYDPATGLPLYPDGYADPGAEPRYPQPAAEIMAGRTALGADAAEMPLSLDEVVVGERSAEEINWREP